MVRPPKKVIIRANINVMMAIDALEFSIWMPPDGGYARECNTHETGQAQAAGQQARFASART
jgi:hypothetical protein